MGKQTSSKISYVYAFHVWRDGYMWTDNSATSSTKLSRNNQHYALICTTPLFYTLAPTCFGSSLPSSGSFLDASELLEIQTEFVVYHIMCGYVACVLECRGSVCCVLECPGSVCCVLECRGSVCCVLECRGSVCCVLECRGSVCCVLECCGSVCCVLECRGSVCCVLECCGSVCWSVVVPCVVLPSTTNSEWSKKLPDDGRLLPKHVGASI
jgi:hypothetical protein